MLYISTCNLQCIHYIHVCTCTCTCTCMYRDNYSDDIAQFYNSNYCVESVMINAWCHMVGVIIYAHACGSHV